ncbi:MAG TPA: aminotransferase class III-fold pyridoxal phosphate-dependent enzyme, partial [Thermoanaerobaculia bacterium]
MNTQEILKESQRWLDIISSSELSEETKAQIVVDTIDNFSFYYNRGYLDYRKSVIEMRDSPALEWEGQGSVFKDILGRSFIDCLGGYGIYSAGIRHPKIVKAVADQLARMPLSSQELLDPLRGALAELLGEIAPGDLQYSFFINNGTDAIEGAIKLARLYTGKS